MHDDQKTSDYPLGYTPMTDEEIYAIVELHGAEYASDTQFFRIAERTVIARLPKPDAEPVAWITHHDEPMLFPTYDEALSFCDDDETPIPLYAHPPKPDTAERDALVRRIDALLNDPWFDVTCAEADVFRDIRAHLVGVGNEQNRNRHAVNIFYPIDFFCVVRRV